LSVQDARFYHPTFRLNRRGEWPRLFVASAGRMVQMIGSSCSPWRKAAVRIEERRRTWKENTNPRDFRRLLPARRERPRLNQPCTASAHASTADRVTRPHGGRHVSLPHSENSVTHGALPFATGSIRTGMASLLPIRHTDTVRQNQIFKAAVIRHTRSTQGTRHL
jgi:hypothetical protein